MKKPLSQEEKNAKKEAKNLKQRQYTARKQLLRDRESELKHERLSGLEESAEQVLSLREAAIRVRNNYDERCRQEIKKLQDLHAAGRMVYEAQLETLVKASRSAVDAKNLEAQRIEAQLDVEFPDLVGPARYSLACWDGPPKSSP